MFALEEGIDYLLSETGATLIARESVSDKPERIALRLQLGENTTDIEIDRARLERLERDDPQRIINEIRRSLT